MLHATSESVASTSHTLMITLLNDSVWQPTVTQAGSDANTAMLSSLAAARPIILPGNASVASPHTEAHGWSAVLRDGATASWFELSFVLNGSVVPVCSLPHGCATVQLMVPQLSEYDIAHDERLHFSISGRAVLAPTGSVPGATGPRAVSMRELEPVAPPSEQGQGQGQGASEHLTRVDG